MKIKFYFKSMLSKALIGVLLLTSIQILGQNKVLKPSTVVTNRPSVQQILNSLQGQGLKIKMIRATPAEVPSGKKQDYGFVAGVIDGSEYNYAYNSQGQVAIFTDGYKAGLQMNDGVLFSTGDAKAELLSRNVKNESTNSYGLKYKDPDLTQIFSEAYFDAFVLEFDVELESHTSALRVAFQFGSEEYPDYVGSKFNDSFGFFVSGPGINGTINMAKNPANQNTITINTINGGQRGASTAWDVPVDLSNDYFYINNGHTTQLVGYDPYKKVESNQYYDNTYSNKPVYIEYNGITDLITYDLTGLQGGKTYRFKIAIADSSDLQLDSGVLIHKIHGTTGADLSIIKEINIMEPKVGDEVEFTLKPENLGPYIAKDIIVTDLLPSGYEFISHEILNGYGTYDPIKGLWKFNELAISLRPEVAPVLKIKARVKVEGEYTNKASITVKEPKKYPDAFPENNYSEVTPDVQKPAAIDLVKTGKVDDTIDGDYGNGVINYTFTITNIGDVPLKDIRLVDTKLPVGTVYNYTGDKNGNGLLDTDEIWIGTATYDITDADTDAEKVENRATVYGKSPKDVEVSAESSDEQGKKQPTITPVEGGGPLMTNPHIYHKVQ